MKAVFYLFFMSLPFSSYAEELISEALQKVQPHQYGTQTFYCGETILYSDVILEGYKGCAMQPVLFGDKQMPAKVIVALYGHKKALKTFFILTEDLDVYRVLNASLIENKRFSERFSAVVGMPPFLKQTNLTLSQFAVSHLQPTGRGLCITHFMKPPFLGQLHLCDPVADMGGRVNYDVSALSFPRAVLLLQDYIYTHHLPIDTLLTANTSIMLKKNRNYQWVYEVVVPVSETTYHFDVSFQGQVSYTVL